MPRVGAASGDEGYLSTRARSFFGVVICGGDAKFLDGVLSDRQDGGEGVTAVLVVDVDTVEGNVALIATSAIDGAVTGVLILVSIERGAESISGKSYPCLQAEEFRNVAAVERQLLDLRFREGSSQGGVHQIQRWSFRSDGNRFRGAADLELQVRGGRSVDQQLQRLQFLAGKTGSDHGKSVGAGR